MRTICSERALWVELLRSVCEQEALFRPTFSPLDQLSVDEIRNATLGSRLWGLSIRKNANPLDASEVYPTVGLKPRATITIELRKPSATFLVPGGRFLLTSTEDYLKLWDLGTPWNGPLESTLICETQVESKPSGVVRGVFPIVSMSVFPAGDNGLRVAIMLPISKYVPLLSLSNHSNLIFCHPESRFTQSA